MNDGLTPAEAAMVDQAAAATADLARGLPALVVIDPNGPETVPAILLGYGLCRPCQEADGLV